jgi:hypothetical protein
MVLYARLHMSDTPCGNQITVFGHALGDASANAGEAMDFANTADNSVSATDPVTSDHEAADPEAADATDADILEYLSRLAASNQEQGRPDVVRSPSPPPLDQGEPLAATRPVSPSHSNTSGTRSQLIIDQFPYGSPGAPIPEGPQGTSLYQATQDTLGPNIWSPFGSQMDWELARWAKLSGPSASAFTELLAIPEVSAHVSLSAGLISLLIHAHRSLVGLGCRTPPPMN